MINSIRLTAALLACVEAAIHFVSLQLRLHSVLRVLHQLTPQIPECFARVALLNLDSQRINEFPRCEPVIDLVEHRHDLSLRVSSQTSFLLDYHVFQVLALIKEFLVVI
jgi:hypothetical protein